MPDNATIWQIELRPLIAEHIAFMPDWRSAAPGRELAIKIGGQSNLAHFHLGEIMAGGTGYFGNAHFSFAP